MTEAQIGEKLKIGLLIYSLQGGGAERMVAKVANYLANQGEDITVFILNGEKIAYQLDNKVRLNVLDVCEDMHRLLRGIHRLRVIRKNIKKEKIDILYAFTTTMYPYGAISCKGLKTKVIGAERANPKIYGKLMQLAIQKVSPLCDGFIFQTKGAKEYYPSRISAKSIVIPNSAPDIDCELKKENNGVLKFCSVGRLHTDKDYDTLFEAYAQFNKQYQKSQLTIYGDGELREFYEKKCKDLKIREKVIFYGFVTNVYEELQKNDIFLFSSKSEGMPNAILEAMACGLACISTDCEYGPSDIIKDGINGLLCKVEDPTDMANKMLMLANSEEKRKRIRREAVKVKEEFSEEKIMSQYLRYAHQIYEKKGMQLNA